MVLIAWFAHLKLRTVTSLCKRISSGMQIAASVLGSGGRPAWSAGRRGQWPRREAGPGVRRAAGAVGWASGTVAEAGASWPWGLSPRGTVGSLFHVLGFGPSICDLGGTLRGPPALPAPPHLGGAGVRLGQGLRQACVCGARVHRRPHAEMWRCPPWWPVR